MLPYHESENAALWLLQSLNIFYLLFLSHFFFSILYVFDLLPVLRSRFRGHYFVIPNERSLFAMPRKKKLNAAEELVHLLQLPPDVTVDHVVHHNEEDNFFLILPVPDANCRIQALLFTPCGSHDCIIRGSSLTQSIRHIPVSGRKIYLSITKRRMFCNNCSSSFYETPDWVHILLYPII